MEAVIVGMDGRTLLSSLTYARKSRKLRRKLLEELRAMADPTTVYQCRCGVLLTDEGFISVDEWRQHHA
jgi:hypothetical protein